MPGGNTLARVTDVLRDSGRLAAVRQVREVTDAQRETFDRLAGLAAAALPAPIALVNLVGTESQHPAGAFGLEGMSDAERELLTDWDLGPFVVASDEPLLIGNVSADPRFSRTPARTELRVVAYAGTPVRDADGHCLGTLCVVDKVPRCWTDRDRCVLKALARSVTTELTLFRDVDRRQRLLDAFDATPVAVAVTRGPEHVVEYLNPAYREVFGDIPIEVPARQAFPELEPQGFFAPMDEVLTTGRDRRAEEVPISYVVDGADKVRYFDVSYSAISSAAGEPSGVLIVAADVTAQAQARREAEHRAARHEAAARATAAVHRSLDPETELNALAHSVVPALADRCTVYQLDSPCEVGQPPPLPLSTARVTAAAEPRWQEMAPAPETGIYWPGNDPVVAAVVAGRPVLTRIDPEAPPEWAHTTGLAPLFRAAGAHTIVTVPVVASGLVLAVVVFMAFRDRSSFTSADVAVLKQLGARANVAVGHGMAYQRSRDHALALQRSMLTDPPEVPGLRLAACYRPAGADAEVGGDWYDAFLLPGGDLAVAIGDVAGHDMAAAATMGQLRSMLRALAIDSDGPPDEVLTRLDRLATGMQVTTLTTLVYGRIRRDGAEVVLRWANAGHPPPVVVDAGGRSRLLTGADGLPLGARPDHPRHAGEVMLPSGSTLLLYTDGLLEWRGNRADDDILEKVAGLPELAPSTLCEGLLAAAPPYDDVALLAVCVEGGTARTSSKEKRR